MRKFAWIVLIVFVSVAWPSVAEACPNCKNGLHENYLALAFGFSVLFMMAMPFSIMAAWTIFIWRANKSGKECESSLIADPIQ